MNNMYAKSAEVQETIRKVGLILEVEGNVFGVDYARRVSCAARRMVERAEVLERECATLDRIISAIEARAKAEEVQVLQGAICPDPTDAGSVQPSVCDPVSQG